MTISKINRDKNNLYNVRKPITLKESDIIEKFVHASGNGGQNVNKVATCVYIKHIGTGIEVKYSGQRTQAANRIKARAILEKKVNDKFNYAQKKAQHEAEKEIRRKRPKPKGLKQMILDEKKYNATKKSFRAKINIGRINFY